MRILVWVVRLVIFLLLLMWAVRNVQPVTLSWLGDYEWQAPLVVMLLLAFLLGVVATLLAMSGRWVRQVREISGLRDQLARLQPTTQSTDSLNPLLPPRT